ncbi:hypothetical protein SAMN04488591_0798 [Microbacterium azadirachtae]|uniref:Pyrrolo-quinoline quinone repeat domain-containing protein n=1 Tax=Microbacterium azadirachtae TaxID=582680 RepID=A0A1I6G6G9_9MICO|nr:hypothetical protein SAMN04488593_0802 [Microbacterium azadirachtae]SEF66029.1 hypothetical protein SAMN04488594_0792 [Microbacterium azadirachtae]SEF66790.1 hypothetical protein SAMN04488592_0801 [Microbacterium azadirachtae]SFR37647.1 hypothetical protein SAMN04488591_0798 [Microbacterium azadirachtae]
MLWPTPTSRVDAREGGSALGDPYGTVILLDADLDAITSFTVEGRSSQGLMRTVPGGVELVVDVAGGNIVGVREGKEAWRISGEHAAISRDMQGHDLLVTSESSPVTSAVRVFRPDQGGEGEERIWGVQGPVDGVYVYGDEPVILVQRRSGPHTSSVIAFDTEGRELWRDDERGVHASDPLAQCDEGTWRLVTDDHGVLTIRDGLTGEQLGDNDWTAGYTTPVAVRIDNRLALLRVDGAHGIELCTLTGEKIWRRTYDLFSVHPGNSAVLEGVEEPLVAVPLSGGLVDLVRLRDGQLLNTVAVGEQAERRPLLGIGQDLLVGTLAGELVMIDPLSGAERWRQKFGASVVGLAAVVEVGRVYVAISTADGMLRVLSSISAAPWRETKSVGLPTS